MHLPTKEQKPAERRKNMIEKNSYTKNIKV